MSSVLLLLFTRDGWVEHSRHKSIKAAKSEWLTKLSGHGVAGCAWWGSEKRAARYLANPMDLIPAIKPCCETAPFHAENCPDRPFYLPKNTAHPTAASDPRGTNVGEAEGGRR